MMKPEKEFEIAYHFNKAKDFLESKRFEKHFVNMAEEMEICILGGGALGKQMSGWFYEFWKIERFVAIFGGRRHMLLSRIQRIFRY